MATLYFDDEVEDEKITNIQITCNGKKHNIKGNIVFSNKSIPDVNCEVFQEYGIAYDEVTFIPSKEGKYSFEGVELYPKKDIEILDVSTMEGNQLVINKVNAAIQGTNSMDRILAKDSTINVSANEKCVLNIELINNNKNELFTYTSNPVILIKYKMDGKEYIANINIIASTIITSSELYAKYVDGLDVGMYYETFYKAYQ